MAITNKSTKAVGQADTKGIGDSGKTLFSKPIEAKTMPIVEVQDEIKIYE